MNEVPTKDFGASKVKKRILWPWIILLLAAAIIAGVSRFALWVASPPDDVIQADKEFKKAKEAINPEQLRAWALEEIPKCSVTNEDGQFFIPNSDIPSYIKELFGDPPTEARVWKNRDQKCILIGWGGPFFNWSIITGQTNLCRSYLPKNQ